MIPKSPVRKVIEATLELLRADIDLQEFFGDRIRPYRAQQLLKQGSIAAPCLALVSAKVEEKLVGSSRTAEVLVSVLIGVVTTYEEIAEPEDFVLEAIDRLDFIKRVLAKDGGVLTLDGERLTDAIVRFENTAEPLALSTSQLLIHDLIVVFSARIDMSTGAIK